MTMQPQRVNSLPENSLVSSDLFSLRIAQLSILLRRSNGTVIILAS